MALFFIVFFLAIAISALIVFGKTILSTTIGVITVMWLSSFLIIDGLFLWAFLGVFMIATLVSMEHDKPGWSTFFILLGAGLMELYSPYKPFSFAYAHPIDALIIVAVYLAIGVAWIVLKWFSHVYHIRDKFNEVKDDIKKNIIKNDNNLYYKYVKEDLTLTEEGMAVLYKEAAFKLGVRQLPLLVGHYKASIYMWWLAWPLSFVWTFLNDPLRKIWNFIYSRVGGLLQKISDKAFKI